MGIMRTLKQQGDRAATRVRNAFRAVLSGLRTDVPVQLVQVKALAGETLQDVELFQQFGFTSGPPSGTEMIIVPLGGKTSHGVIIGTEHGSFRVTVSQGETCIYNQWGAKLAFKKERLIHMECDDFIADVKKRWQVNCTEAETNATTIQHTASAQANYNAPALTFGGRDGKTATAAMNANIEQKGWHKSTGDHEAGGVSLIGHVHPENDNGGPTGPPLRT